EMTRMFLEIAKVVRDKEPVDLALLLRGVMYHYLPDDAHLRLRNRLYISMTILQGLKSGLVTDFRSKEHLIDCLIASAYVPGFIGWIPPGIDGDCFVDVHNRPLKAFSSTPHHHSHSATSSSHSSSPPPSSSAAKNSPASAAAVTSSRSETYSRRAAQLLSRSVPLSELLEDLSGEDEEERSTDFSSSEDSDGFLGEDDIDNDSMDKKRLGDSRRFSRGESYLNRLVWMCFRGFQKTSSVMRSIPVASQLLQTVSPKCLGEFEGFLEALLLEMVSNRYTVLDGGFSDNIPCFDSNTITVCPFAGEADICPRDLTAVDMSVDLGHTSFHISEDNIFRLNHALNPMEPEMLLSLCEEGYNECLRFLHRKELLSCKHHLMTRASISTSSCNIGHAHCRCQRCRAAERKIRRSLSCIDCQTVKHRALKSILPDDVRNEFHKAIEAYKANSQSPPNHSVLSRMVELLWWCAEKMYAGTMAVADLAIEFYDNMACFTKFAILPLGQKRKLIRYILSSLRHSIGISARRSLCSMPELQAPICR
ncbi:patatin-like phospholipase domain-containing protein 2, partial [Elysia marginata]